MAKPLSKEASLPRRYAQIPEPGESIETLRQSVSALKQTVEELTGQSRKDSGGQTNTVFFMPEKTPVANRRGDMWITPKGSDPSLYNIFVWADANTGWVLIT